MRPRMLLALARNLVWCRLSARPADWFSIWHPNALRDRTDMDAAEIDLPAVGAVRVGAAGEFSCRVCALTSLPGYVYSFDTPRIECTTKVIRAVPISLGRVTFQTRSQAGLDQNLTAQEGKSGLQQPLFFEVEPVRPA